MMDGIGAIVHAGTVAATSRGSLPASSKRAVAGQIAGEGIYSKVVVGACKAADNLYAGNQHYERGMQTATQSEHYTAIIKVTGDNNNNINVDVIEL